MKKPWLLIVRGDGSKPRVADPKRTPKLRPDEIAFRLSIDYPAGWQQIVTYAPEVKMPEPPAQLMIEKEKKS